MSEIKKVDAQFLLDSGLLFRMNQVILHPFGLALETIVYNNDEEHQKELEAIKDASELVNETMFDEEGQARNEWSIVLELLDELYEIKKNKARFGGVWDYREDPEGMLFEDKTFDEGFAKFQKFMDEFGRKKIRERFEKTGCVVQGELDLNEMYEN
jgi:hypothetical protein